MRRISIKWAQNSIYAIKFFKIEEVEYLIHYVKLNMWPALFYVNFLCFLIIF